MKDKIVLIGPINKGHIPCTGDTMKNQLFLRRFLEVFKKVYVVDTYNWKKRPWCLLWMIMTVLLYNRTNIILSANPSSADLIVKIFNRLKISRRTFYWVVGGYLHKSFEKGHLNWCNYKNLAGIFVQGTCMEKSMKNMGLSNVSFVPNSKYISYIPTKKQKKDKITHFVFLSRIEEYKGCNYIFKAVEILLQKGYKGKFDVTFYGKTTDKLDYFNHFKRNIEKYEETEFKGVLNLRETKNYDILSTYDVMLFPTYWQGEGFPGVIIDAYIAGLPVIASDWNLNRDVVKENETGWIIPTHDVGALAETMIYVIEHQDEVARLSVLSQKLAKKYDSRHVLSEENLYNIGILK